MELTHLRAFCAVAQSGSVTAAAKRLNRVPSNVTVRIRQLEEEFGRELFIRERNRLHLAPAGRQLLEHAERILELCGRTEALMRHQNVEGRLTIGALDIALEAYLPELIGRYRERFDAVTLDVRCAASEDLIAQLLEGGLDLAVSDGPIEHPELDTQFAFSETLVLITEKRHPPVNSAKDLDGAELYGFRQNCSYRLRMDQWLERSGVAPSRTMEMESYPTILACVSAGSGAAWIPQSLLATLPGRNAVRSHDLGVYGRSDLYFAWRKAQLAPCARQLVALGAERSFEANRNGR